MEGRYRKINSLKPSQELCCSFLNRETPIGSVNEILIIYDRIILVKRINEIIKPLFWFKLYLHIRMLRYNWTKESLLTLTFFLFYLLGNSLDLMCNFTLFYFNVQHRHGGGIGLFFTLVSKVLFSFVDFKLWGLLLIFILVGSLSWVTKRFNNPRRSSFVYHH